MNTKHSHILFSLLVLFPLFNTVLLPQGLYYTTLLTPLLFIGMVRMGGLLSYSCFFAASLVFLFFQMPGVEHWKDYLFSFLLLQSLFIFVICFYLFLRAYSEIEKVFKYTAIVNAAFLIPALLVLFIPGLRPVMWYEKIISAGIQKLPRLKMFTYEASYYSLSLVPLMAYYGLKKMLFFSNSNVLFLSLGLSFCLSFSLGVIGGLVLAVILLLLFHLKEPRARINVPFVAMVIIFFSVFFILLYIFYPDNPLFERLRNIYSGKDTSARGRTYESFHIAWNVIKMKSVVWGLGPGQFKFIGRDFLDYYYVLSDTPAVARIPNAVAETLCIYGVVGITIRFALILYFFIKTRVWNNYYRLFLFLFIFIYQFTGSFLFNPIEYAIWTLAFCPGLFVGFNKENIPKTIQHESFIY